MIVFSPLQIQKKIETIEELKNVISKMKRTPFKIKTFQRKFSKYFKFQIYENEMYLHVPNFNGVHIKIQKDLFNEYLKISNKRLTVEIPLTTNYDLIKKLMLYDMLFIPIGKVIPNIKNDKPNFYKKNNINL